MKRLLLFYFLISLPAILSARIMRTWSYQELLDGADLVVIAKPIVTKDTPEKAILPGITPDVHMIGVETEFEPQAILKGEKTVTKLVMHHYRFANEQEARNRGRPNFAYFDPKKDQRFLLFLVREADGRYAPVSGQADPILFSVLELSGHAK